MKKYYLKLTFGIILVFLLSIPLLAQDYENNQELYGIRIGNQIWSAKNIDFDTFNKTFKKILFCQNYGQWKNACDKHEPAFLKIKSETDDNIYYYNWWAVIDENQISPKGWRVPNQKDWSELFDYVANKYSGKKDHPIEALKSTKPKWKKYDKGNNLTGFNAKPFGEVGIFKDTLRASGWWEEASFWSSTNEDGQGPEVWLFSDKVEPRYAKNPYLGLTLRLIKDQSENTETEFTENSPYTGFILQFYIPCEWTVKTYNVSKKEWSPETKPTNAELQWQTSRPNSAIYFESFIRNDGGSIQQNPEGNIILIKSHNKGATMPGFYTIKAEIEGEGSNKTLKKFTIEFTSDLSINREVDNYVKVVIENIPFIEKNDNYANKPGFYSSDITNNITELYIKDEMINSDEIKLRTTNVVEAPDKAVNKGVIFFNLYTH